MPRQRWVQTAKWLGIAALWAVLLLNYGLEWSQVFVVFVAVFVGYKLIQEIAEEAVSRWVYQNISPGVSLQRSIVFPRVWTFQPVWYKRLLEELKVPAPEESEIVRGLMLGTESQLLSKLVIEEYASHTRVHQWFYLSDEEDRDPTPYNWFDIPHRPRFVFTRKDKTDHGDKLWSYSTEEAGSALHLSCAWEQGVPKERIYLKLTMWLDHASGDEEVLYQIPLDPGLLDDENGRTVFDEAGEERKASEVLPYPGEQGDWEAKSGGGDDHRWAWYLRMQNLKRSPRF